ncbi:MAG: hypothetical protein H0Z32_03495 [Bacillaceae bacterium]|nr:hypothetical protein [Bacillaceae bacterium]
MTVNQYELEQMIVDHKKKVKKAEDHHSGYDNQKQNRIQANESLENLRLTKELRSRFL